MLPNKIISAYLLCHDSDQHHLGSDSQKNSCSKVHSGTLSQILPQHSHLSASFVSHERIYTCLRVKARTLSASMLTDSVSLSAPACSCFRNRNGLFTEETSFLEVLEHRDANDSLVPIQGGSDRFSTIGKVSMHLECHPSPRRLGLFPSYLAWSLPADISIGVLFCLSWDLTISVDQRQKPVIDLPPETSIVAVLWRRIRPS